jgi:hypothetical protein
VLAIAVCVRAIVGSRREARMTRSVILIEQSAANGEQQ